MTDDILVALAVVRSLDANDVPALDTLVDTTDQLATARLVAHLAVLVHDLAADLATLAPQRFKDAAAVLDAITARVVGGSWPPSTQW